MPETTATGRPRQGLPIIPRLLALTLLAVVLLEAGLYTLRVGVLSQSPVPMVHALNVMLIHDYLPARNWVLAHVGIALGLTVIGLCLALLAYRGLLLVWHNEIVARLTGTRFVAEQLRFPSKAVDVLEEIQRRPAGHCFVGLTPTRRMGRVRWQPVYISPQQRTMHRHVLGKTGSGKTLSVLWPSVLQDALDGKGVLVMDAKGSDENARAIKAIAKMAKRESQLRIFSLPAWNQMKLPSHTYNMVYVRPRTPTDAGGDPAVTAERVFSVLPLGDNEYYNTQAQVMFTNLCKLLHGMVDSHGHGLPFTLRDVAVCLRGIANVGGWNRALWHCLKESVDREASLSVNAQARQLGQDVNKCFSGILGAIDRFLSPLVNAYAPDIIIENVLEENQLVYIQLPANLFRIQAPAIGRVLLQDVKQEGSLRQVFRHSRNQRPFAVVVDEFYNFADLSFVDSLNKLRDANLEYTLAHQSIADLELVSREFATAVWDNTRTKDILAQDNPELCEKLARSIGTRQVVQKTVRMQQGALFTSLMTGDASSRLAEEYRLHPNHIKSLARSGQGYLFNDEGLHPICYGMLPHLTADYTLTSIDRSKVRGLRLYEQFVAAATEETEMAPRPTPRNK